MMMEKSKPYFQPTAELIEATALDILTASGGDLGPEDEL